MKSSVDCAGIEQLSCCFLHVVSPLSPRLCYFCCPRSSLVPSRSVSFLVAVTSLVRVIRSSTSCWPSAPSSSRRRCSVTSCGGGPVWFVSTVRSASCWSAPRCPAWRSAAQQPPSRRGNSSLSAWKCKSKKKKKCVFERVRASVFEAV